MYSLHTNFIHKRGEIENPKKFRIQHNYYKTVLRACWLQIPKFSQVAKVLGYNVIATLSTNSGELHKHQHQRTETVLLTG